MQNTDLRLLSFLPDQPVPMTAGDIARSPAPPPPTRRLDQVRNAIRVRHDSIRTEAANTDWALRSVRFDGNRHRLAMGAAEVDSFLSHLPTEQNVAASTQNQVKSAPWYLYGRVLGLHLPWINLIVGGRTRRASPVVCRPATTSAPFESSSGTEMSIRR